MVWWRTKITGTLLVLLLALVPLVCSAQEPIYRAQVVQSYPHDPAAFTQGLLFHAGFLYEGTGLYGESFLRQVRLEDGEVVQQAALEPSFFGEGTAVLEGQIFQLTWREGRAFVYDLDSFDRRAEFSYVGEGWGLTTDGRYLIMSDGSSTLRFREPSTFEVVREINVEAFHGPVPRLNELEYVGGEIWANVWLTNLICRIDPESGQVLAWIDLTELADLERKANRGAEVLNGIAYDGEDGRVFVTGKLWSTIYEIRLVPLEE